MAQIHELLPLVMDEIGAIPKLQRNTQGSGYTFRGIDDALRHCGPVLSKHKVCLTTRVHDVVSDGFDRQTYKDGKPSTQRCYRVSLLMDVTFHAPDGSRLRNTLLGEAIDFGGDKASNKAMAAAMKYGLFFGLVIPVDRQAVEDSDRDLRRKTTNRRPPASPPPEEEVGGGKSPEKSPFDKALLAIAEVTVGKRLTILSNAVHDDKDGKFTEQQIKIIDAAIESRYAEIKPKG